MANEQKQQIELITVEVDSSIIEEVREKNKEIQQLINTFGQIYIRRKELEEELSTLDNVTEKNEEAFKDANKAIQSSISELEKEYPRGQLNLEDGTVTYNPAFKAQMEQQSQSSPIVEEVKE